MTFAHRHAKATGNYWLHLKKTTRPITIRMRNHRPDYAGERKKNRPSPELLVAWRACISLGSDESNDNDSNLCTIGRNGRRSSLRKKLINNVIGGMGGWCEMHGIGTQNRHVSRQRRGHGARERASARGKNHKNQQKSRQTQTVHLGAMG